MKGSLTFGMVAVLLALTGCQSTQLVVSPGSQSQKPSVGVEFSADLPQGRTSVSRYGSDPESDVKQEVKELFLDFTIEFTRRFLLSLIDRELNGNKGPRVRNDKLLYRSMITAGIDTTSRRFVEPQFDEPRHGGSSFGDDRPRYRR